MLTWKVMFPYPLFFFSPCKFWKKWNLSYKTFFRIKKEIFRQRHSRSVGASISGLLLFFSIHQCSIVVPVLYLDCFPLDMHKTEKLSLLVCRDGRRWTCEFVPQTHIPLWPTKSIWKRTIFSLSACPLQVLDSVAVAKSTDIIKRIFFRTSLEQWFASPPNTAHHIIPRTRHFLFLTTVKPSPLPLY